jgi:asparagine synthase (glutamine-hydrolysing)
MAGPGALPAELPLDRQRDALQHRGPDDYGSWFSPDRRVAFGHRRLSILDLSERGAQPMRAGDDSVTLILNGEIYNHEELRRELRGRGHAFRSRTDTEVLLEAYRAWGHECVHRLRGMFAFALFDRDRATVFLARDRAGEKPLFYSHAGGRFAFASELKGLLSNAPGSRAMDVESLHEYLAYGYVAGGRSIFRGVHKLPSAHAALYSVDRDALDIWRYWSLPEPEPAVGVVSAVLEEELEVLLEAAVKEQLVADVPVGILLSGGLDSSLITAFAVRASGAPVRTFNISFPGHGSYDEAPFARAVADHLGTRHTELVTEPASVELLPMLAGQFDEPLADSSMIPTYLVSREIARHATVALGGDGGDELFGGYPHYNWIQWQARIRRLLPGPARRMIAAGAAHLPSGVRGRNHLMGMAGGLAGSLAHINLYFDRARRAALLRPLGDASVSGGPETRAVAASGGGTPLQRASRLDFGRYLVDDILTKVDRASMLVSLEVRAPLLDHRIVEFAFGRVPDHLRATATERKVLLRRLGSRLLPPTLDLRRKQGFSIPLHQWFQGEWGSYMREVLAEAPPTLFDQAAIRDVLRQQEKGRPNTQRLFALTMFELWRRHYGAHV